jgi:phage tail sheath protein FI
MPLNLGINVIEVDGSASPTIVAAAMSTAGFLIRSQRGVPNTPIHLRGMPEFVANLGTHVDGHFGSHALQGFFGNGGSDAIVVRVVGEGHAAATATLEDRVGAGTLSVTAGARGRQDPGAWGNALEVGVADHPRATAALPAQIASANSEPFALGPGQTLEVRVNGGATASTVTFHTADFGSIGAALASEVVTAIKAQTAAFRAAVGPGQVVLLASSAAGPASRLEVAGTAAAGLGFAGATANTDASLAAGTTAAIVDSTGGLVAGSAVSIESRAQALAGAAIAGVPANSGIVVTADGGAAQTIAFQATDFAGGFAAAQPAEVVTAINRQANGFFVALTATGRLLLQSNSLGPGSTIALGAPAGGVADATGGLGLTGVVPVAGTRQSRALTSVVEASRLVRWSGGLSVPVNASRLQSAEFDLLVSRASIEVERFESLTMQPGLDYTATTVVNDPQTGSRYVVLTNLNSGSGPAANVPAIASGQPLSGGSDGNAVADASYIGDSASRTGLYAFDTVPIQLLACPESTATGVVEAALAYCELRGDAMFVGTVPFNFAPADMKTYAAPLRGRKVYGALYGPWIRIVNPTLGPGAPPFVWVPPVGHVLGAYVRIGEARGVFKAPAGDEAFLNNALSVQFDMTDAEHTDLVKNGGVNGIRAIPGSGIVVDASRTLSTDTRWLYVNVRRLFNFIKSSLRDGLRFVAQEPNTDELRNTVRLNVVTPFLLGLWRQGAFGSDPPDKVFSVICDASNNPAAEVNIGNFKVEAYFYPVKPAETIVIVVGQQDSAASAAER